MGCIISRIFEYKCDFCNKNNLDHIFLIKSKGKFNNKNICKTCLIKRLN